MTAAIKKQKVPKPKAKRVRVPEGLSKKTLELLGYSGLENAQKGEEGARALAGTLHDLNISVLNKTAVESYKSKRMKQANKTVRRWGERYAWKSTPLRGYRKPVPVSALKIAARIVEVLPGTKFTVEELIKRRARRMVDPFLCVSMGTVKYYIAHWDEPTFEDK
jgi:hypothetical protein